MGDARSEVKRSGPGDDLASLRRLDAQLVRTGFRHADRTAREWVADLIAKGRTRNAFPIDAHEALVAIGPGAVPALLEVLTSRRLDGSARADACIRENALAALMAMTPPPRCVVPALLGMLSLPGARLRRAVLRALVALRPQPSRLAVRRLLEACRDREDWTLRALGLDGLGAVDGPLPEDAEQEALLRLADANKRVRQAALRLLSRRTAPSPRVLQALEDQVVLDDDNRVVALQVLARVSPDRALPLLEETARGLLGIAPDDRAGLRRGLFALHLLAGLGARARPMLGLLRELQAHALSRGHGDPVSWPVRVQVESVADAIVRASPLPREAWTPSTGSLRLAACLASPLPGDATEPPFTRLEAWLETLGPLSQEEEVRLCVAVARLAARVWDSQGPDNDGAQSSLLALEAWVETPDAAHQRAALEVGLHYPSQLLAPEPFHSAWSIHYAALMVMDAEARRERFDEARRPEGDHFLPSCVGSAYRALTGGATTTVESAMDCALSLSPTPARAVDLLHGAMVDEVLPWARGEWDPLRDVMRARRQLLEEGARARVMAETPRGG